MICVGREEKMIGKKIYISLLVGGVLGTFCGFGYSALFMPQLETIEVEKRQSILGQVEMPIKITENEEIKEIRENSTKEKRINEEKEINETKEKSEEKEKSLNGMKRSPEILEQEKKDNSTGKSQPLNQIKHQNKGLNNYNIMFFGIEDNKLQMLTVYSINKENKWQSGTVFIPTDSLVPGTKYQYLADYFYQNGPEKVEQLVEEAMEINIDYYVEVDRNLLLEVEPFLEPIYVKGERVNLAQLFTKEITPEDEIILASLLKNLTQSSIYFGVLPKLVLTCKEYINTDFELSWTNLWVHYQIAKNIDTTAVKKKIISGKYLVLNKNKYWIPNQEAWWNTVYEVTK